MGKGIIQYKHDHYHNTKSAEVLVPLLLELLDMNSVIDVGCGTGTWLKVFSDYGIEDYFGIDGDNLDKNQLEIDVNNFAEHNLNLPYKTNRKYDLVVSLEVAEHINGSSSENFIETLVNLGDVILFSGAIPGQGGQHHVNEQWPSYWQELFRKYGYDCHDIIRPKIWNCKEIYWFYKQNCLLVTKQELKLFPVTEYVLPLVHPELYQDKIKNESRNLELYKKVINGELGISSSLAIMRKALMNKFKIIIKNGR